jgi:hypothetical protein
MSKFPPGALIRERTTINHAIAAPGIVFAKLSVGFQGIIHAHSFRQYEQLRGRCVESEINSNYEFSIPGRPVIG